MPCHAAREAYAVESSDPRGLFPSALRRRGPAQAGAVVLGTVGAGRQPSWLCPPGPRLLEGVACARPAGDGAGWPGTGLRFTGAFAQQKLGKFYCGVALVSRRLYLLVIN